MIPVRALLATIATSSLLLCAACEPKNTQQQQGNGTPNAPAPSHGASKAAPADAGKPEEKATEAAKPADAPKPAEASKPADAPKPSDQPSAPAEAAKPAEKPATPAGEPNAPATAVPREDGMIIEDLVVGNGPVVPKGAAVVVHYRGTLKSDGSEFDSSYKLGKPAAFPLQNLIKGWQEGIPGMKPGGKRKLTIPYALAYGEKGRPPVIPEKADLVFEIELVDFIQVEDTKVGDGAECKPNQTVRVYYRGTLKSDGKEFDSNMGQEPIEFPLQQLIRGWQLGIPGMKVGGTRKLTIPWQYAYGEQGSPPAIPPRADLVFEIQLVGVK